MGSGPVGVAVNPQTGRVYVADWYEHKLFVVDPDNGADRGRGRGGAVAVRRRGDPDGALVLTADRDSNEVSIIDTASHTRSPR